MKTVRGKKEAADERFARNPLRPVIEKMAARIVEEYHPEEIILYGSQATGVARPDSDIDLFVVKQTQENFFTRCTAVKRIVRELRGKIEVSPIVFTPEEVLLQLDRGNRFIQHILERGIQLYHDSNFWEGDSNIATKREDSLFPQDWVRVAERDWQRVEKRLSEGDQEDAGFRLQQALEKYLKAFLLANKINFNDLINAIKRSCQYGV
ncbi:MAG: HEPN domain-containing protein [candidate division KSB1 bacterium]|nr:HEPN domain-containing protein [candidate division KSB1 bacterium]MDZ7366880.1 HEPN domain-containing protein [candidate division KSB1 bacterium]MDZ7406049.1 HEPN domain-containing protein [candidate division KSB1 bacterium]